jgi:hypothetical protein
MNTILLAAFLAHAEPPPGEFTQTLKGHAFALALAHDGVLSVEQISSGLFAQKLRDLSTMRPYADCADPASPRRQQGCDELQAEMEAAAAQAQKRRNEEQENLSEAVDAYQAFVDSLTGAERQAALAAGRRLMADFDVVWGETTRAGRQSLRDVNESCDGAHRRVCLVDRLEPFYAERYPSLLEASRKKLEEAAKRALASIQ